MKDFALIQAIPKESEKSVFRLWQSTYNRRFRGQKFHFILSWIVRLIVIMLANSSWATEQGAISTLQTYLNRSLTSATIQKLPGMTNENYLISESNGDQYVIRIPGFATSHFIDRSSENRNSQEAFNFQFTPTGPLYFNLAEGTKITKYITNVENLKFEDFYRLEMIEKIVSLLRDIHKSPMQFSNEVNISSRINSITKVLFDNALNIPPEYYAVKDDIDILKQLLSSSVFEKVPTHGDPVPGNFIFFEGRLMLFDWEYSGLNDPAYDLAFLANVMDYPYELEKMLVTLYKSEYSEMLHAKLIFFKPFVEFWLGLWGLTQTVARSDVAEKDFFLYFAIARFRKSQKYMQDPSMAKSLKIIQQSSLQNLYNKNGQSFFIKVPIAIPLEKYPPLVKFPILCDETGFFFATPVQLGLWICPYCGILNPSQNTSCLSLNCPNK